MSIARRFALALALTLAACASPELPAGKPVPATIAQAEALKQSGTRWDNGEIRAVYLTLVRAIGPANQQWIAEGTSAEERAKRAFQMRHDARIVTRAMMSDPAEVALLEKRDQEKYGRPDGPTFEMLVQGERQKGKTGDAVYEAIVESAQRTDRAVNELFNLR